MLSCNRGFFEEVHGHDFDGFKQLDVDPTVTPVHHELFRHIPLSHHQPVQLKDDNQAPTPHQYPHYQYKPVDIQKTNAHPADLPQHKTGFIVLKPVLNSVYNQDQGQEYQHLPEPEYFSYQDASPYYERKQGTKTIPYSDASGNAGIAPTPLSYGYLEHIPFYDPTEVTDHVSYHENIPKRNNEVASIPTIAPFLDPMQDYPTHNPGSHNINFLNPEYHFSENFPFPKCAFHTEAIANFNLLPFPNIEEHTKYH